MPTALGPIMRDYLVRYQRMAIKETGRRPLCLIREPMETAMTLPGCQRPGYAFWQPIAWKDGKPPLGPKSKKFHASIVEYLSMCQFLEIRFRLPVAAANSPLAFLYGRVFECCRNTELAPPSKAFEEALLESELDTSLPLMLPIAVTCDAGEPLRISLRAEDGAVVITHIETDEQPIDLKLTIDRLLPKLQFVYDL